MIKKIVGLIETLVAKNHSRPWVFFAVALIVVSTPAALMRLANYIELKHELTQLTLARRQSIATSSAQALGEQLQRVEDFTASLAANPSIRDDLLSGKWEDAITSAHANLELSIEPFIDRMLLTEAHGILLADYPALNETHGQDLSALEWFTGVVGTGNPYLTSVYLRTAEPRFPVVAVAAPIKDDSNQIIGIIVIQIALPHFTEWVGEIKIGNGGFLYIVDQRGQLVTHPKYNNQNVITDFSKVPVVRQVLAGKTGIAIAYNQIDQEDEVTAYAPVQRYGWGVLARESKASAFAEQSKTLRRFGLFEWAVTAWNVIILLVLLTIIQRLIRARFVEGELSNPASSTKSK